MNLINKLINLIFTIYQATGSLNKLNIKGAVHGYYKYYDAFLINSKISFDDKPRIMTFRDWNIRY